MEMWGNERVKNFKTLAHLHFKFTYGFSTSHLMALYTFFMLILSLPSRNINDLGAYLKNLGE